MNKNRLKLRNVIAIAICLAAVTILSGCEKEKPKNDPPPTLQYEPGVMVGGKKWATRNLAKNYTFVENPEDYGALYQWGRYADGHEQRNSPNYPTNNNVLEDGAINMGSGELQVPNKHPAYGKFIKQGGKPYDWRTPQRNDFWCERMEISGAPIKAIYDPCPEGWRLPTDTELKSLFQNSQKNWGKQNGVSGYFFYDNASSPKLFLPAAGFRWNNGNILVEGSIGNYWSSSCDIESLVNGYWISYFLCFQDNNLAIGKAQRTEGISVRCIADE